MSIGDRSSDDSPIIITRLVDDSGWSIAGGFETFGQRVRLRQPLLHHLARRGGRCPGSKTITIDDSPGTDCGADRRRGHGDAVEQVCLERNGDQLLDLLGGEPERLGLDLTVGGANSGRTSTGRVAQLSDAEDDHARCRDDEDAAKPQAGPDDPPHVTLRNVGCNGRSVERRPSSSPTTKQASSSETRPFNA